MASLTQGPLLAAAPAPGSLTPAASVTAILSRPESTLDYTRAKLEIDRLVDPALDVDGAAADLDRLAAAALQLAGREAGANARLAALRRLIYESGWWNGGRPFAYEHDDPRGLDLRNKLLPVYLATRRGNCVSMPILFLILADRLSLDLALACAPTHLFLRWRDESGGTLNLETTSGAHPTRDAWYRQNMPMTDLALANGLYMRSLGRREAVAMMASTLLEHLLDEGRFPEAAELAEVLLGVAPRNAYLLVMKADAIALIAQRLEETHGSLFRMPLQPRLRHLALLRQNAALIAAARALGWQDTQ